MELTDDAVFIHAWMQAADLTGSIMLASAAVALQLAAESQQVSGILLHHRHRVCARYCSHCSPRTFSVLVRHMIAPYVHFMTEL